jgi:hypothetical protein
MSVNRKKIILNISDTILYHAVHSALSKNLKCTFSPLVLPTKDGLKVLQRCTSSLTGYLEELEAV